MKTRSLLLAGAQALLLTGLVGCGDVEPGPAGEGEITAIAAESGPLALDPRVDVLGVEDVFDVLEVTHLGFDAELFLLPIDNGTDNPGAVATIRVDFVDGEAHTEAVDGALDLEAAGKYRVLLRIAPLDDGVSVDIHGAFAGPESGRLKGDDEEPAPTPAEPAPTPAEPAPTPAEPAPTPAEPAPTPADGGWGDGDPYEPIPKDGPGLPSAEPAPTPAEPAPTPARAKDGEPAFDPGVTSAAGAPVSIASREAYEFYVGVVDVLPGDTELVITWDVRQWLRDLLAEPLGIDVEDTAPDPIPGAFVPLGAQFQLIAQ